MITLEEVKKISKLSRLEFDDEKLKQFQIDLSKILDYINKLNELDTEGIEPSYAASIKVEDLRKDVIMPSLDREKLLKNAPEQENGAFKVPTVVE